MSVPKGYKRTEVGVIPEEWECTRLADIAEIVTGNTPPTHDPSNYGDRHLFVSPGDLGDRKYTTTTAKMLSKKGFAKARRFPSESILFVCIGSTIGKCGMAPEVLTSNQQINAVFPGPFFSSSFLYYGICFVAQKIKDLAGEQAVPLVNKTQFSQTKVALPPLPEQRAIAEALGDVDALLGALDAAIAKQRDLKQAAMQQLLTGQTRLPGFQGEWERKRLKEMTRISVTDGPHLTPDFLVDGVPFLSVNNLVDNRIDLSDLRYISREDHLLFSLKCKPQKGDILLGKAASVGKVALVTTDLEFNIWSPIALVRVNEDNDPMFVYYQFQGAKLISQITLLTNSSSQGNIGMGDIERLNFQLPPFQEQVAIATILSDMDDGIAALESRRAKTAAIKQAMMQELLTGRTRLMPSVSSNA